MKKDFLFEILTEELPPKNLLMLSNTLKQNIEASLHKENLNYENINSFATPRRLAILITSLEDQQPERFLERRGPSLQTAFDKNNQPTKACLGFARSCGVNSDALEQLHTKNGSWVIFKKLEPGKLTIELLPNIFQQALKQLPITKPMRWGDKNIEFIRPIHNIIMLYDTKIIDSNIFDLKPSNKTLGHRFLYPKKITISSPKKYEKLLEENGFVIADFAKRKKMITDQINAIATKIKAHVIINDELLNEVTNIVEWPVALLASFAKHFLRLPKEVLISSLENHQKCFALADNKNKLLPCFIAVSNIISRDEKRVIAGNERVVASRLSDAEFFYVTDNKQKLESNVDKLKNVIFQQQLGSLFDKTQRLIKLSSWVATFTKANLAQTKRAALLAKADLMTKMVGEFPELQGIIGRNYTHLQKENKDVSLAIDELYMPRHAGGNLPMSKVGQTIAIADRIDTLVGLFGINKIPSGDKDPFGLRRAAFSILRIIIEKKLELDLLPLIEKSKTTFKINLPNKKITEQIVEFLQDRLKSYALDNGFTAQEYMSVAAKKITNPFDFYRRLQAVNSFCKLSAAKNLTIANKRVNHLLAKQKTSLVNLKLNSKLLQDTTEIKLAQLIKEKTLQANRLYKEKDYVKLLKTLASLSNITDEFFDKVMVMTDDNKIRINRLILLSKLRELFLQVADISLL